MTIKLKLKSLALFDLTIVFVQASLCLKRLQKGCSTVHNKSWQNCCQRCNSCQEFAVCQLLIKIDIVLLFKLPPCYVLCLPLTKRRHCFQFQNLNLPRAKISSDLSHRKDGRVMLKCSGSGVNSEKKHLQLMPVCTYSCTCSQCMCTCIVVLAANACVHV